MNTLSYLSSNFLTLTCVVLSYAFCMLFVVNFLFVLSLFFFFFFFFFWFVVIFFGFSCLSPPVLFLFRPVRHTAWCLKGG